MLRYFCFLAVILGVRSALAPFIKPCKPNDNECALQSVQAAIPVFAPGVPELGVKPVDPMHLDVVKSDQAGLRLTFKDTKLTGMKGCHAENFKADLKKHRIALSVRCTVDLTGDYKLGGQLLVLPVQGEGKYHIKIRDIVIKTTTHFSVRIGEDGKEHWHVDTWHHSYQTKGGAEFKFQNLFNGNKALAEPVEQFINTSWREVMQEVAGPIVHAIVATSTDAVSSLYDAVPSEEFFIPA